jgi:hypothetical protein
MYIMLVFYLLYVVIRLLSLTLMCDFLSLHDFLQVSGTIRNCCNCFEAKYPDTELAFLWLSIFGRP